MKTAGISLLFIFKGGYSRLYEDLFHGDLKKGAECVEIIHGGKALASLPLVNRLRLFKAEVALKIPDTQPAFNAQLPDVAACGRKIDDRK